MKKKDKRYHIHITSGDQKAPRGFKLTTIILENKKIIREHNMFTRTFVGTKDVQRDVEFMKSNFSKMFNDIQRFKIELLNEPYYLKEYNEINYREVHLKLKIQNDLFNETKEMLKQHEETFNFRLSNNPREVNSDFLTQFVNMRYFNGSATEADAKIQNIVDFLNSKNIQIIEKKEEISVYDTNFDEDRWWTE